MKVVYEESIEFKAREIIKESNSGIIFREDLSELGSYRQVSRVLNKLIASKELAKIGQGVYAKAYESEYIDYPLLKGGFGVVAREALDRLGIEWEMSSAEAAYNSGETQQVPVNHMVRLKTRCRRQLSYAGLQVKFEGDINAR